MNLKDYIDEINDFPKPWISFKDMSPILADHKALDFVLNSFELCIWNPTKIVWLDARWFIFWSLLAYKLKIPFVMLRKSWKLPWNCESISYDLEYGSNTFELQKQSIKQWDKVSIVDDLLATWWSVLAAVSLIEKLGWKVESINNVIELEFLWARDKMSDYKVNSLIKY
jgi:adenine phosphoribosyltransferase